MVRTFQSRLGSKLDHISQKLNDNAISLSGTATDVIRISTKRNVQQDAITHSVSGIDIIEIMFPALKDVPMWRFLTNSQSQQASSLQGEESLRLFECAAPISSLIDRDDIIVKFFENPAVDNPLVLILQIKDILGTFGQRSILYSKILVTFYDEALPDQIKTWCLDMARRRKDLKW
jgi:hypothetical protein